MKVRSVVTPDWNGRTKAPGIIVKFIYRCSIQLLGFREMTLNASELGRKYPIVVVEYDPRWKDLYQEEARFLKSRFNSDVLVGGEY